MGECKGSRANSYVMGVFTKEEFSKEPFLRSIGPVAAAQCPHEEGSGQGKGGEERGPISAEKTQPFEDAAPVGECAVEVECRDRRH